MGGVGVPVFDPVVDVSEKLVNGLVGGAAELSDGERG
jgi:hypothetical protein